MRSLLLLAVLWLLVPLARGQAGSYSFSRLDISGGLSHNQVNAVLKDSAGFVWLGTMSGLNRYDGYSFKVFRNIQGDSTSLIDNYVSHIWDAPQNKLWITTRNGVSIYDPKTESFDRNYQQYLAKLGLPAGNLRTILHDRQQRYWLVYEQGRLYRYETNGKVTDFTPAGVTTDRSVLASIADVQEAGGGNLWVLYRDGLLVRISGRTGKVLARSRQLQQQHPGRFDYRLFADEGGDLWVWAVEPIGAFYFAPRTDSLVRFHTAGRPHRLSSNIVNGISQDGRGAIWIGTDHGGINLVRKSDLSVTPLLHEPEDPKSLAQNSIYTLYRDRLGILWAGTYKQGVSYLNEHVPKFPRYSHQPARPASLPYEDINCFVEEDGGNLWIGTNGGGLIHYDRKQDRFTRYQHRPGDPSSLSNNVIVSMYQDPSGVLWIGTYFGGLNRFDGRRFTHYLHNEKDSNSLSDDRVWEIFEDRAGRLWVGTLNGGLNVLDRSTGRFRHYQYTEGIYTGLQSNYISALQEDRQGNLWIGTANGIDVLHPSGAFTHYASTTSALSNNNVISLFIDSRERVWAGTREGLSLFDPATARFQSFTSEQGLPSNTILTITEDRKGGLWVTTPNGLAHLSVQKGGNGQPTALYVVNYDEANNLQGREFNENAALMLRSGELVVAGPYGFNFIHPDRITTTKVSPVIALTDFQLFNKSIAVGERVDSRVVLQESVNTVSEISLRYSENVFSIEFAALDFAHGSRDRYAYRLDGFNEDWLFTDGAHRKVTYTNLDPGRYSFRIKALASDGSWGPEKILVIRIRPPFWRTPLAFVLYALLIAGALLLARRLTIERARMRFEVEQQRQEAERAHALDRLKTKFFTNVSHEFRTPLSLILSPLDRLLKQSADPEQRKHLLLVQRNAKRLLNLINQLLDFRKMEVQEFRLNPAMGDLVHFCRDISYSFSDISENRHVDLQFSSDVESLDMYFDKDKMEKILFNLLSNAFKYTPEGGRVQVSLALAGGEEVTLRISDTGIGIPAEMHEKIFERFFQAALPPNIMAQGSGIGLVITREFVKLHKGTIRVESAPEKGTTFILTLPIVRDELIPVSTAAEPAAPVVSPAGPARKERATVLIVEDNEDFRFYLKDNLKQHYTVVEATNGREGWEKVREVAPDIVVSDIMMPYLNGIELSKKIKGDPRTAHIPIILLTAVGNEEMQLEGYKKGISDYITKPFTFEILASRVRNLLAQQQQLISNYQKHVEVNPSAVAISPVDEQFLQQALEKVEEQVSNPDFTVEELSRALFISRVALYKKLLALTGKTPLEFIRLVRLKQGAQLLEKSGLTVAEVAFRVGFNNPKNFARYFKEEFGVLPSRYPRREKKEVNSE